MGWRIKKVEKNKKIEWNGMCKIGGQTWVNIWNFDLHLPISTIICR